MIYHRSSQTAILFLLLVLTGCGSPAPGDLSGTVTLDGKPLVYGSVLAAGPDGLPNVGKIQSDGSYKIDGLAPGKTLISVHSLPPRVTEEAEGWFPIPEKYTDPIRSELKVTVQSGANPFDIELEGVSPPPIVINLPEPNIETPFVAAAGAGPQNLQPGQEFDFIIKAKTFATWHIYPPNHGGFEVGTALDLKLPEGIEPVGDWQWPQPMPNPLGKGQVFEGEFEFKRRLRVKDDASPGENEIQCLLSYQTCDHARCLPPDDMELTATVEVVAKP